MPDVKRRSRARGPTRLVAVLVVAASLLVGGRLVAGSASGVRGKLSGWDKLLPQVYAEAAKSDSHRYTWRDSSPSVKQDFQKLSANVSRDVCVVAFGNGTAAAHEPVLVKVTGGRLTPSTLVLSIGSRLSFKNVDPFPHELYEVGNDKWGPNPTGPGSTREWAATSPGLHPIRDRLFPSVVMYVLVDPAAVEFAMPDREGAFSLSVPAGEYVLKAFFDGKQVGKDETVRVGEKTSELKEPIALAGAAAAGDTK
jgi:hypothetical protein